MTRKASHTSTRTIMSISSAATPCQLCFIFQKNHDASFKIISLKHITKIKIFISSKCYIIHGWKIFLAGQTERRTNEITNWITIGIENPHKKINSLF